MKVYAMLDHEMEKVLAKAAGQALEAPAKETGHQLSTLIDLIFTPLQAAKIYRDAWIEDYKSRITQKFKQIPSIQLQEPPIDIIGPALEASKYYIAVEEMREMFANLVAHACDQLMNQAVHPSFVDILTQMSPLESAILASFRPKTEYKVEFSIEDKSGKELQDCKCDTNLPYNRTYTFPEINQPIVNYYLAKGNERMLIQGNVLNCTLCNNIETISAAVSNLMRLGLIEVNYSLHLVEDTKYEYFSNNEPYQQLKRDITPLSSGFGIRYYHGNPVPQGQYNEIVIDKGIARLTQFGYNFIKVCVLEKEVIQEK